MSSSSTDTTSLEIERAPLEVESFPQSVRMHVGPQAPAPMKMMAARGMVPVEPEVGLRVLYQLSFDDQVGDEAHRALDQMPAELLIPSVQATEAPYVLDWIAEHRVEDGAILDAVIINRHTDDRTVARIAGFATSVTCDLIANNQVRVLRSPMILERMYQNANARMSVVDKLVDLARRNGVRLEGLPALQAALDSGQDIGLDTVSDDPAFDQALREEQRKIALDEAERAAEEELYNTLSREEREQLEQMEIARAEQEEEEQGPLFKRMQGWSIAKKIRMASVGSRETVELLMRDPNKLVHMAAIRSPRVQFSDIRKYSANKQLPDNVIRHIANNRDWTRHYEIKLNLVNNPKTPLPDSIGFLNHLRVNDLRHIMRNRNISHQLARQAKSLANKRTSGRR